MSFHKLRKLGAQVFFFGAEMCGEDNLPLTEYAGKLAEKMREKRVLLSVLGPHRNTLKIRPPMVFSKDNADQLLDNLRSAMKEVECEL